ncbi:MAG: hypothetical protein ACLU9X_08360 [Alistipes shahii]
MRREPALPEGAGPLRRRGGLDAAARAGGGEPAGLRRLRQRFEQPAGDVGPRCGDGREFDVNRSTKIDDEAPF